jgi:hypothetical protein
MKVINPLAYYNMVTTMAVKIFMAQVSDVFRFCFPTIAFTFKIPLERLAQWQNPRFIIKMSRVLVQLAPLAWRERVKMAREKFH